MRATFDGYCVDCREPITRGDPITVCVAWRTAIHEECELAHHLLDAKQRPIAGKDTMTETRADKITPGTIIQGFPNRTVLAVERFDKPGQPTPWVRLTIRRPPSDAYAKVITEAVYTWEVPPDHRIDVWPARDDDEDADK